MPRCSRLDRLFVEPVQHGIDVRQKTLDLILLTQTGQLALQPLQELLFLRKEFGNSRCHRNPRNPQTGL